MRRTKRKSKNILAVIVFTLLLAFLVSAGTIAWLTRTSSISNKFTVGSFESPTTDPIDPTKTIDIDVNVYEPNWNSKITHKLIPDTSFAKDPYVGIGAGSEDAVVYVNVENNFSNKVYFTINTGWEPVTGYVTLGYTPDSVTETRYTSGLFKYTAGLTAKANEDVWTTTPIFSSVKTDESASKSDFTVGAGKESEIVVSSFLHQAKDGENNVIDAADIQAAAIKAFYE